MASPSVEELRAQIRGLVIDETDVSYDEAGKVCNWGKVAEAIGT